MGSILDNIKTAGAEIQNELTEKIKEGTDAASQSEQLGALFKEMPEGLDDDVKDAVKESRDAAKKEAEEFLKSEVADKVEDIGKKTQELGGQADDLVAANDSAQDLLNKMDSVRDFGSSERAGAMESARRNAADATAVKDAADSAQEQAQQDAAEARRRILDSF